MFNSTELFTTSSLLISYKRSCLALVLGWKSVGKCESDGAGDGESGVDDGESDGAGDGENGVGDGECW